MSLEQQSLKIADGRMSTQKVRWADFLGKQPQIKVLIKKIINFSRK